MKNSKRIQKMSVLDKSVNLDGNTYELIFHDNLTKILWNLYMPMIVIIMLFDIYFIPLMVKLDAFFIMLLVQLVYAAIVMLVNKHMRNTLLANGKVKLQRKA